MADCFAGPILHSFHCPRASNGLPLGRVVDFGLDQMTAVANCMWICRMFLLGVVGGRSPSQVKGHVWYRSGSQEVLESIHFIVE